MDKAAKISLSLNQKSEAGDEKVNVSASASYGLIGGRHFVKYEEKTEDGAVNKVLLKFDEDSLEMTKSGEVSSYLCFGVKKRTEGSYKTPYGNFVIETDTKTFDLTVTEKEIRIILDYTLFIDGELIADCKLRGLVEPI